jgi:hypothetical protein
MDTARRMADSFLKTRLQDRDKEWLGCLPEEENKQTATTEATCGQFGFNRCRYEFLANAKKKGLPNK